MVFWHTLNDDDDADLLQRIIKEFEAEHPLVTIEPVYYASYNKVNEALAAANVANVDVPGCAFINVPRLKAYADNGVIENLNPYIAHYGVDMSDFVQGFLDAMQVDGHQVAFPVMPVRPGGVLQRRPAQGAGHHLPRKVGGYGRLPGKGVHRHRQARHLPA